MEPIKYFESLEFLEPKCPGCSNVLDYGASTEYVERLKAHVCKYCKTILK